MRFSGAGSELMAETMGFSGARRVASVAVLKYSGRERTERIHVLGGVEISVVVVRCIERTRFGVDAHPLAEGYCCWIIVFEWC
jgi:hypothetical protein